MQYKTILVAEVPRVECKEHGVHQVRVPWAEPGSRFTAMFEWLAIDWLLAANLSAVAKLLDLSWDQVDGIQQRAVIRGLARRQLETTDHLGVDETSFQRRHEYVTVVADAVRGKVLHVVDGHKRETLADFLEQAPKPWLSRVKTLSMDMYRPYISAALGHLENAVERIAFDKFHVAQLLGRAVDLVRREEHRQLLAVGDDRLKKTKYLWLKNPENFTEKQEVRFEDLQASTLKTARAWAIKELAMTIWESPSQVEAEHDWAKWYGWAIRSRLAPIKKAARTIKYYLWGILNAMKYRVTNAMSEGINTKIQAIKRNARGFRSRRRFRNAIYFHLGGLDLYPKPA
jgi:transposase